jgi:hypothetical protein
MQDEQKFTLHRTRPGAKEYRMIGSGLEGLEQYAKMPRVQQEQSFGMIGGMRLNHLEMDNLVRSRRGDVTADDS